jgi:hypothetical protein
MQDVVSIQPTLQQHGLIAYECPKCRHLTSEIVPPDGMPTQH